MKQTEFTLAVEKLLSTKLKAIDKLVEEMVEPLAKVGDPESLIKKPYNQWTPEDLQKLVVIYGTKEPNPLSRTIFNNEYKKTLALEAEV